MTTIATAPHELEGNLIFTEHGLSPYWAVTNLLIEEFDGSTEIVHSIDGEQWTIQMSYQKGGIAPRSEDEVGSDRLYEVRVAGYGHGERKANFLIQPRFRGMSHYETGDLISTPFEHIPAETGVNVRFSGSNLEPDRFPELLCSFIDRLAQDAGLRFNRGYFAGQPHEMSNITTYERYLRITREWSSKVVGRTGVIHRLSQLYASEKGSQYELRVDNEDVVGKNTRLLLSSDDARKLVSGHRFGKQIKHYHPKHVRSKQTDDPLYHPKVGVLLKKSLNDGAFAWSERDELRQEIDETLINVLYWSDVPVRPDPTTYVADDHFEVKTAESAVSLETDPTPEMEAKQEALLVTTLRDLCESDVAVLETLVSDGGDRHPRELAESTNHGISTIYRALDRLGDLVQNDRANVSIASKKLEQEIASIVESTEYQIRNAADRAAKLLNIDTRMAASSAWQKFCSKYGAKIVESCDDHENEMLRIDTILSELRSAAYPRIQAVLHDAMDAWHYVGRDVVDLREMRVTWRDEDGNWRVSKVKAVLN